jgi:hypothetical protein
MVSPVGGRLRGIIDQAKDFVTDRRSKCSGFDAVNRLASSPSVAGENSKVFIYEQDFFYH